MGILPELFLTFAKIGAFTFGGGYAMIALLDHECVENKHWITSDELMDVTAIAESTPGPIAINCATYTGYRKAGIKGAVSATAGMILPSFFVILLISSFFENMLQYRLAANAFRGIRAAVAVLIIHAAVKMIRKMLSAPGKRGQRIAFVISFAAAVLSLNAAGIRFSTIYLIIIAGMAGLALSFLHKAGAGK